MVFVRFSVRGNVGCGVGRGRREDWSVELGEFMVLLERTWINWELTKQRIRFKDTTQAFVSLF